MKPVVLNLNRRYQISFYYIEGNISEIAYVGVYIHNVWGDYVCVSKVKSDV